MFLLDLLSSSCRCLAFFWYHKKGFEKLPVNHHQEGTEIFGSSARPGACGSSLLEDDASGGRDGFGS